MKQKELGMAKTENKIVRLSELNDGQSGDCFVLLVEKERRQTRNGNPFFLVHIRDRERRVAVRIWNDSELFAPCGGNGFVVLEEPYQPQPEFQMPLRDPVTCWPVSFRISVIFARQDRAVDV